MARIDVGTSSDLAVGETRKFTFQEGPDDREGFVIRHESGLFAYRNECRHIPMTMDFVDNRFLSRDGCYIQCSTHGALFKIENGLCVAGPPEGKSLRAFTVSVENDRIWVETDD